MRVISINCLFYFSELRSFSVISKTSWGRKIDEDQHKYIWLKVLNLVGLGNKHDRDTTFLFIFSFINKRTRLVVNDTDIVIGDGDGDCFPCFPCIQNVYILFCFSKEGRGVISQGRLLFLAVVVIREKSLFGKVSKNCLFRNQLESWTGTWDCLYEKIVYYFIK